MNIYKTTIFRDTTRVAGLSASEKTQHIADETDFDDNFKAGATLIGDITLPESRPVLFQDWIALKAIFTNGADLFYIEINTDRYDIYFFDEGKSPSNDVTLFDKNSNQLGIEDVAGQKVLQVFDVGDGGMMGGQSFKKISYASEVKNLNKGGKNKISIRPRVLTENMIEDTNNVQTLGSGGITDVGQVFRLTTGITDIDRFHLCLEAIAGGAIQSVDDFESYADTAALVAVWVPSDNTNTPATLETSIIQEGAKAMKVNVAGAASKSKNDSVERTYSTNQDWSAFDGIQFQFRRDNTGMIVELHIEDASGNASKHVITTGAEAVYEFVNLNFNDFIPVGGVAADLATIKKVKFFIKTAKVAPFYIDIIELFSTESFGTVDVELYDFGADPAPTTLGTLLKTETISLGVGKKVYEIPFNEGGLTSDNYYGIVLTNPSVSTIKVFGKNGSDRYLNGFSFDSSDDGVNIASTGSGDDLFFMVFALDQAIFNGVRFTFNASPGRGKISSFINDNASFKGKTSLFLGEDTVNRTDITFPTRTQTGVAISMAKEELMLIDYQDDGLSLATIIQATVYYTFIDRTPHG